MPKSFSAPSIVRFLRSSQQVRYNTKDSLTKEDLSSKEHKSQYLLLATYFDVGIIRTLFSPSWVTDGYLWCLEYLNKRMNVISDEILSDALTTGKLPINILRVKSLSMPQIKVINEYNYSMYVRKSYYNERITHDIIREQGITSNLSNSTRLKNKLTKSQFNAPFEKNPDWKVYIGNSKVFNEKSWYKNNYIYYFSS